MRQLGQLEAAVMDRVWDAGRPVLVRDVLDDLQRDRDLAYTTVMTVMDNLYRKGFVLRERQGRAFQYTPAQSREEHTASVMEAVLVGSSSGDRTATLMHFVEQIDSDDLAVLQSQLARRLGEHR